MGLREAPADIDPFSLKDSEDKFLIFYSSRDEEGKLWCPDCRAVEGIIENTFGKDNGPAALIVYVGQKPEWKSPSNPFRAEPWNVDSVPTIIKLSDSKESARLVGDDIEVSLPSFTAEFFQR